MSDEDIGQGQSMDRCTVRLIRKRKCVEEITIGSDSDDQEDKVTPIKEKKKQTPRIRKSIKCTEWCTPKKYMETHERTA